MNFKWITSMKKINLAFVFVFFCFPTVAQNIDLQNITLHLNFDWLKNQANGTATITFSTTKETDEIFLDAGFLSIENVVLDDKDLSYQYDGKDSPKNLAITLDRQYKPTELIAIQIAYHTNYVNNADPKVIGGSFGKGLRFFQPTSTTPKKQKQMWSSGEPESNKYWFPGNEDIADIHTTEIFATVEKPLMVISNGKLVETIDNKNGTQTFHYKSEVSFPHYLVAIAVGEYTDIVQQTGKTTIHTFGYPTEKDAVKDTVVLLPDMLQFLEQKTGFNYPFQHYKQVVVQDYPFPGTVGQHNMALISDNYIDDYGVHKDFKYLWDGVAMQTLTNQWFGNIIMPKSWNDIWLNNAFAQYFAGLYTEKDNGRAEYLLWYYPFEKGAVLNDWQSGNKHAIVPEKIEDLATFTSDSYSKFRGALVLRMLHNELGDKLWWKTIKYYVAENKHKLVSTKDFKNAVEKMSNKSFQWFFDQWIYKTGLPKFLVNKTFNADSKKLTIVVNQAQEKDATINDSITEFFQGKIAIEIDGKIATVFLKPQKVNTYQFSYDDEPTFVNFNVENRFLSVVEFSKTKEEYLAQLTKSTDMLAKQEALNKLLVIANDSLINADFKSKIKTTVINEVQSQHYWRYRMIALNLLSRMTSAPYNQTIISLLNELINNEKGWLKSAAINFLGSTNDPKFTDIYIQALNDESDRVINTAAIALGKTKSPKAFDVLMGLENQKSWKNQNRISALDGLQQLGDVSAIDYVLNCIKDNQSARWYLATPRWDYPYAAVNTLVALGKGELAYPVLIERFKKSLDDNDVNDIFQNVQLINLLKDKRATELYGLLKEKYTTDDIILDAIKSYEQQFLESINEKGVK